MEGQNKRTEVTVECVKCGDVFPIPMKDYDDVEIEDIGWLRCQDCLEEADA